MTKSDENSEKKQECKECCGNTDKDRDHTKASKGIFAGIIYGLVPHAGCIAFLIAAVLGATAATTFFKPLLMSAYFFYILIALSLVFATISALIYLNRCSCLSLSGAKNRWKYLATLYSTTIIVNLLLFMVIFPMVTANLYSGQSNTQTNTALLQAADNVGTNNIAGVSDSTTASNVAASTDSTITLRVDIPCPGHAALISEELKKLVGVNSIDYNFPNTFKVGYDASKVTKSQILGIDVFKSYPATVLSEDVFPTTNTATAANPEQSAPSTSGSCGGGCGGGCGGSGSSCGASGSSCGGSSGGCGSGSSNSYGGSTCGGKVY